MIRFPLIAPLSFSVPEHGIDSVATLTFHHLNACDFLSSVCADGQKES